jgi:uncharacterized GH25 family protein
MIVLLLGVSSAGAHHIWIIPQRPDGSKAVAVFSDTLAPDPTDSLRRIAHTKLYVRDRSDNEELVEWTKGDKSYAMEIPGKGDRTVGGTCIYGVEMMDHRLRKQVEPYLLVYYPKLILGEGGGTKPWARLPLEILSSRKGAEVQLQVLFRGKPLPNAEMFVLAEGQDRIELKTDADGKTTFTAKKEGIHGFRTRMIEPKAGEHNAKKYVEIRHYASLVQMLARDR